MIYEILDENDNVINTIVAEEDYMLSQYPEGNYREKEIQAEIPSEPPVAPVTKITRLAFLNRFTDAEAIALDLASIGATVQAASIRRYMSKVNAAEFIDLSRTDTRDGVMALESAGLIAEGRGTIILDTPVADSEKAKV